jgi:hypothetical protein
VLYSCFQGKGELLEQPEDFEDDHDNDNYSNYIKDVSAHAADSYQFVPLFFCSNANGRESLDIFQVTLVPFFDLQSLNVFGLLSCLILASVPKGCYHPARL